ncbi:MAG: hypothetical protein IR153_07560 [Flavobacterium sp.]|nr:hypothetical protein [Flavobacterium sp.]
MKEFDFIINLLANLVTIAASCLAIYIYFANKEKINSALNFILNYSNQLTLTDLKFKIERLNEFNSNDAQEKLEVINILNEIEGQILGNNSFKLKLEVQLRKIEVFTTTPKLLTEPKKRSLVSELKESVRNLDVSNYNNILNE